MINVILQLGLRERIKFLKGLSTPLKREIFNSIPKLTNTLNLHNVNDYKERIERKKQHIDKFPNGVFWDYAEILPYGKGEHQIFKNLLISTNGDLVRLTNIGVLHISSKVKGKKHNKYQRISLKGRTYPLHRLVASTFIPIPERLKEIPYNELHTNHIDSIKFNNPITNLEWTSGQENTLHAYNHQRYKDEHFYLFEVTLDNGFLGRKFIIPDRELKYAPFNRYKVISRSKDGKRHYGMTVKLFHEIPPDVEYGIPEDIFDTFNKSKTYFDPEVKPVIGTIMIGKYKGLKFSLFGTKEIRKYFLPTHVHTATSKTKHLHYNCGFVSSSIREAIPLHGKLTDEIYKELMTHKRS